ncbi:MAG TPA: putative phage abortive infection protein [Sphingomicrobium sp.]|nr:putative phage abortive infection protein [Sphingomicrobium sp.]
MSDPKDGGATTAAKRTVSPSAIAKWAAVAGVIWFLGIVMQGWLASRGWTFLGLNYDLAAQFGSSLSGLGAAAAGIAALGAWQTVSEQRAALQYSQSQADHLNKLAAKRDFETTFFNLQGTLERIVEQMDVGRIIWKQTGKDAFSYFVTQVYKIHDDSDLNFGNAYARVFLNHQNDLAHYFRTLFNLIQFVDRCDNQDCYFYVRLIRATLSEPELVMIALNGLFHEEGRKYFKPLIEKYALLNNVSASARADLDLLDQYAPSAFKRGATTLDEINEEIVDGE